MHEGHAVAEALKQNTHLQALGKVGGCHADALPLQACIPHDCHGDLDACGVLQLRRGDGVQPGQQRPQRCQHLQAHAARDQICELRFPYLTLHHHLRLLQLTLDI